MRIENQFKIGLPLDEAWKVLLDIERIAPCMPGAELQENTGDEYRGVVKVKLGALTMQFKGAVRFAEIDDATHRIVMQASGRDVRGQGNANATVTAVLTPNGDGTEVSIDTDLSITGKVAQFGRGVMAEVSNKLLAQFVSCLETDLAGPADEQPADEPAVAVATAADERGPRSIPSRPAEPVDLLAIAGGSVARRALPVAGVAILLGLVLVPRRRVRWLLAAAGAAVIAALSFSPGE